MSEIHYIGWIGHCNAGDDAMLDGFVSAVHSSAPDAQIYPTERHVVVYDGNPGAATVALGGGTLIGDDGYLKTLRSALSRGMRGICLGAGVVDFEREAEGTRAAANRRLRQWAETLSACAYVGVRGHRSAEVLRRFGVDRVEVFGDLALLCSPVGDSHADVRADRTPTIGINLGCSPRAASDLVHCIPRVRRLIKLLVGRGFVCELNAMHPVDLQFMRSLNCERIRGVRLMRLPDWRSYCDRCRAYACVVGQRLHAVVLAHLVGTPAISLAYREKCHEYMESVGEDKYAVPLDRFAPDAIADSVEMVVRNRRSHSHRLVRVVDGIRTRQSAVVSCQFASAVTHVSSSA